VRLTNSSRNPRDVRSGVRSGSTLDIEQHHTRAHRDCRRVFRIAADKYRHMQPMLKCGKVMSA
jgi:hypothetical protein